MMLKIHGKDIISLREFLSITVGVFFVAVSVYIFMIPAGFATGSLSGLVVVLANFIPFSISFLTFVINAVLLVLGFILLGNNFGFKTIYASNLLPFFLWVFEKTIPDIKPFTSNIVLSATCVTLSAAIGLAMLFDNNASSGGLDIVAMIASRYLHMEVGSAMSITGGIIALSSYFVYDVEKMVVGVLSTFCVGKCIDMFIMGAHGRKRVNIISDEYAKIKSFIIEDLDRGCTIYDIAGGYSETPKREIQVVLAKNECGKLIEFIKNLETEAFVSVTSVSEVFGPWNQKRRWK